MRTTLREKTVATDRTSAFDLLPTFAALSEKPVSHAVDGFDISPVLLGEVGAKSPRTNLYSIYGYKERRLESFRDRHWKLHLTTLLELYDLSADLSESTNRAAQHPDVAQRLDEAARQTREATQALKTQF